MTLVLNVLQYLSHYEKKQEDARSILPQSMAMGTIIKIYF